MLIKAGVDISRLRPEIRKKQNLIARVVWSIEQEELIVTSTYEGNHSEGSLHYANLAEDIRRHKKGQEVRDQLAFNLGRDYDIVLKGDHIHIEYDPKQ
jgi:hypothetical protein